MPSVGTAGMGAGRWGQLDMAGEVWEWTLDWYAPYVAPCTDCAYLANTSARTRRGGSFFDGVATLLAASRSSLSPTQRVNDGGFRCAQPPP